MHFEFLLEERSAEKVLRNILPKIITGEHTYNPIVFNGKMDLLRDLPSRLRAYSKWIPEDYRIVVLVDRDNEDCQSLKYRLNQIAQEAGLQCKGINDRSSFQVMNRIAIEELESWFFGDPEAVRAAFPGIAHFEKKAAYRNPDEIRNTWESLERLLQRKGYYLTGYRKIEAADKISGFMQPLKNRSKSFQVFWTGLSEAISQG